MKGTKKWWASKTIWGIIIAVLGIIVTDVLKVPDVNLPADATVDQVKSTLEAIKAAQGNLGLIIGHVATLAGLVLGVIGRIQAEKTIA
jgi:hypothetical protein